MEQAPECWGKFDQCGRLCEFAAACRLCTETESRMNRPIGGQDFDGVAEWAPDLADYSHIPGDEPEDTPEMETHGSADLAGFLIFILHLDDYTLGILRRWDNAGVHTVSEITALEPETRTSAVSAVPAAVGQTPAQPTDSATLAAWEQDWAARVRSHRRNTEE